MARRFGWLAHAAVFVFCVSFVLPTMRDAKIAGSGLQDYLGFETAIWAVVMAVFLPIELFTHGFTDNVLICLWGISYLVADVGFVVAYVQLLRGRDRNARGFAITASSGAVLSILYCLRGAVPLIGFWLWIACPFVLWWIAHRNIREATTVSLAPTSERHSS